MHTAEIDRFHRDGFLCIPRLVDDAAVTALGTVYDAMLAGEIDVSATDNPLGRITRQIMMPSAYHPLFEDNPALDAGRAIARDLLGVPDPRPIFDMLIYKEPGQTAVTPWHQDFAYSQMPFAPAGVAVPSDQTLQFWLALDDVDEANGCMHFVPGQHRAPLLEHHVAAGEAEYTQRLLAIPHPERNLDLSQAIACPLRAGGATVHNYGTPHFTSGNVTANRPRRAYIFNFSSRRLGE
ncbi:phytanoyl-CoA dioxygenase family protein [Novosphingobium sp. Gsoil 351]|uniref:phytanoyl-CoA dioxygenase family protein n=1 Tax=Novosphingobium sp. Gsoil 351 TaxID=2675225 RepID=UPI0018A7F692|nr:phytanoyl-CoA dioxygenase family protein [Novosphingobium sp. Gsoil 351]